jgi:hypothetical protein
MLHRQASPAVLSAVAALAIGCSGGGSSDDALHDAAISDAGHEAARERDAGHEEALPDVHVPNRSPGQRTPLSADCDPMDGIRCALPWPNNTFTVVDTSTATGLRVNVSQSAIAAADNPTSINRADGFSRVSPIETGFDGIVDSTTLGNLTGTATGAVRLVVEQPGATFGSVIPVRYDVIQSKDGSTSLLVAYPKEPLVPNTDYAVVVMNSAKLVGGQPLPITRASEVALGLAAPRTSAEGALYAYEAPAREAMKVAGIANADAVRVWDFTTRSLDEPTLDLLTISAAEQAAFDASRFGKAGFLPDAGRLADGGADGASTDDDAAVPQGNVDASTPLGFVIDAVDTTETGSVKAAVVGRITGVPYFLDSAGAVNRNASGTPVASGVHDVPFRAAIPVGTGDYRVVMYGHGTGGMYDETSFDQEITQNGATKIGTQFIGWTATSIINTFTLLQRVLAGSEIAADGLTQSLADTMLVQHALGGSLGALLGEPILGGTKNPAAGRHPTLDQPVWAGGSLGGTMGFVYSAAEPSIGAAVLNVPGAAWTQFVVYSYLFGPVEVIMEGTNYPDTIDVSLGVAMSQLNFDPVDGANWQDAVGNHHALLLEQESIGDPVLPNIGNDMVAVASHADQVGVVLNPILDCPDVPEVMNHNGMTQFKVPADVTAPLDIHGFAAGSSPAGVAAQQQIVAFIASVWAGSPAITVPPECETNTPKNSCDFTKDYDGGM